MKKLWFVVLVLASLACSLTPTTKATPPALPVTVTVNAPAVKYVAPTAISTLAARCMRAVGDVNLRAAPSVSAEVLGWLLKGQGVDVLEIKDGWAKVKQGYIKAEWLDACP